MPSVITKRPSRSERSSLAITEIKELKEINGPNGMSTNNKIFVNLPVRNLPKAKDFFGKLAENKGAKPMRHFPLTPPKRKITDLKSLADPSHRWENVLCY